MTNKYIEFKKEENYLYKPRWFIINKHSGNSIGEISWYNSWRRYVFIPDGETVWDINCLQDIIKFISEV